MNKTELIAGLREHLAGKESIANEAAPALKLMRYSLVELEKPTSGGEGQALFNHLNEELKNADGIITQLRDTVSDREGFIYALLAELALVPEIDGEPVGSLEEAITQQPDILDMLQERVSTVLAPVPENQQEEFIEAVRALLGASPEMGLRDLYGELESKAKYLNSLEQGIAQRDQQIAEADRHTLDLHQIIANAVGASGMPTHEPVSKLGEYVRQVVQQRDEAAKELANTLFPTDASDDVAIDGPAHESDYLESIIEPILAITGVDWQDVETLPQHVQQLCDDNRMLLERPTSSKPLAGWVSDAIDLAHAVRGNLAPENRVMAKAAEAIILSAPGVQDG